MATHSMPQWLVDLRERKRLREVTKKVAPTSPEPVENRTYSRNSNHMVYRINDDRTSDTEDGSGYKPAVTEPLEIFTGVEGNGHYRGKSPVRENGNYSDNEHTEINMDYVRETNVSNGLTSDGEDEEYRPGFVMKLRSKWAKRAGTILKRRKSGEIYVDHDVQSHNTGKYPVHPASHLAASETVDTPDAGTHSIPLHVVNQSPRIPKPVKRASSMENLLDHAPKSANTIFSFTTDSLNASKNKKFGSTTSIDKSDHLSNSAEPVSSHSPKTPEPERVNSDDELPRPNTVLAALSMFEKPGSKKKGWKPLPSSKPRTVFKASKPATSTQRLNIITDPPKQNGSTPSNSTSTLNYINKPATNGTTNTSNDYKVVDARASDSSNSNQYFNRFMKPEPESKPEKPQEVVEKPESVSSALPTPVKPKRIKKAAPKPPDQSKAHVVFDFRHHERKEPVEHNTRHTGRPNSIPVTNMDDLLTSNNDNNSLKLDLSSLEEPAENDISWMDFNPQPSNIQVVGGAVKTKKSAIKGKEPKRVRVQFSTTTPGVCEYQSEDSLLEELGIVHEAVLHELEYEKREAAQLRSAREGLKPVSPSNSLAAGELASYRSQKQSLDYEFGQNLIEEQEQEQQPVRTEPATSDVSITPAAEEEHVTWSGNSTSDILF